MMLTATRHHTPICADSNSLHRQGPGKKLCVGGLHILEAALSLNHGVPKHRCAEATSLGHLSCVPRGKEEKV